MFLEKGTELSTQDDTLAEHEKWIAELQQLLGEEKGEQVERVWEQHGLTPALATVDFKKLSIAPAPKVTR